LIKDLVENKQHVENCFKAAIEKYPKAKKGIIFFAYATGLMLKSPSQEDMDFVAKLIRCEGLEK